MYSSAHFVIFLRYRNPHFELQELAFCLVYLSILTASFFILLSYNKNIILFVWYGKLSTINRQLVDLRSKSSSTHSMPSPEQELPERSTFSRNSESISVCRMPASGKATLGIESSTWQKSIPHHLLLAYRADFHSAARIYQETGAVPRAEIETVERRRDDYLYRR